MSEIELKLHLSGTAADSLGASGVLPGVAQCFAQRSLYFDTPDRALAGAGLSLRIREAHGARVQTVKQAGSAAVGMFDRSEWESSVPDDQPVLDDTTPVAAVLGDKVLSLAPIFTVHVERRRWIVEERGARIEVVIDRGHVVAADRQSPLCEGELELLSGPPRALFALARRLNAVAPVRLGVQSKSERGYRLIGPLPQAVKAAGTALEPDMTAARAFQRIALSCLRQFRLNEDLLLATQGAEPLHQARVALRRLRSALTIFRPMLGDSGMALQGELRWLAGALGSARDLDVLSSRTPGGPMQGRIRAARDAAHEEAANCLESDRARSLMLDLAEWIERGGWTADPAIRDGAATDFAAAALSRLSRKVRKRGRRLTQLDDEARHDLRKTAKKLRYAADFFDPLFRDRHPKSRKRFVKALETLQDHLGHLNDLATAPLVLERLGLPPTDALATPPDPEALLKAAQKAHRALVRSGEYWQP